jgi:hypothetical protein
VLNKSQLQNEGRVRKMYLTPEQMASALIRIYQKLKRRYYMEKKMFRALAKRKRNLRGPFLWDVNSELHKEGYTLVDLRDIPGMKDFIAVIKIRIIAQKWKHLTKKGYLKLKILLPGAPPKL